MGDIRKGFIFPGLGRRQVDPAVFQGGVPGSRADDAAGIGDVFAQMEVRQNQVADFGALIKSGKKGSIVGIRNMEILDAVDFIGVFLPLAGEGQKAVIGNGRKGIGAAGRGAEIQVRCQEGLDNILFHLRCGGIQVLQMAAGGNIGLVVVFDLPESIFLVGLIGKEAVVLLGHGLGGHGVFAAADAVRPDRQGHGNIVARDQIRKLGGKVFICAVQNQLRLIKVPFRGDPNLVFGNGHSRLSEHILDRQGEFEGGMHVVSHIGAGAAHEDLQLFPVFNGQLRSQGVALAPQGDVAAVVADLGTGGQAACPAAQILTAVGGCIALSGDVLGLGIEHGIHKARVPVVFNEPVVAPQLRVHAGLGKDLPGKAFCLLFVLGLDIVKPGRIGYVHLGIIRQGHGVQGVDFVVCQSVAVARGPELGHPVLGGGIDDLRLGIQLLLAQLLPGLQQSTHGQGKQHAQNGDDQQQLYHGKAAPLFICL